MKNVKNHFCLIFLFVGLMNFPVLGQSIVIKGNILNSDNAPVEMGNILLLSMDSTLIKGDYFMDGKAELSIPKPTAHSILLRIVSLGYNDYFQVLDVKDVDQELIIPDVVLINDMLEGVTIQALKPIFQQEPDGIKMNVEETMLANSTSISEMLSKSPNLSVSGDGVGVVGKGDAIIYFNNQQISIEQMKALSVNQIKEVKIITNPSAKYDAGGRAVVQIIAKKNNLEGISANVKHISTQANYYVSNTSVSIDQKKGGLSMSAGLEMKNGKEWEKEKFDFNIDGMDLSSNFNSELVDHTKLGAIYRLGLTYDLNDTDYLSIKYNGNMTENEPRIEATTLVNDQGSLLDVLTENSSKRSAQLNSLNANYNTSFAQSKSKLFIGAQYSMFTYGQHDIVQDQFTTNEEINFSKVDGKNNINILSGRMDFETSIGESAKLQIGSKLALTQTDGNVFTQFKGHTDNDYAPVLSLSNDFDYEESIYAFYSQLDGTIIKNVSYSVGLRTEATDANGFSVLTNKTVIDSSYVNVFPNVAVSFPVDSTKSISINYTTSIGRPNYQDLDPFVSYNSYFTSYQGNPLLTPSFTHDISATFDAFGKTLSVGYAHQSDAISYSSYFDEDLSSVRFINENLEYLETYYLSLFIPLEIGKWSAMNGVYLNYDIRKDPSAKTDKVLPWAYFYHYQQYILPKDYVLELTGRVRTKSNDGIYERRGTYTIDLGVSKTIFTNIDCSLMVNDVFNSTLFTNDFNLNNISSEGVYKPATQSVRISLSYNFGKLKANGFKNTSIDDNEIDRIKN